MLLLTSRRDRRPRRALLTPPAAPARQGGARAL
ncbi:Uncharacterised protein [Actinomyces howellii]|uniref:Uncharacterized protein n=1 Tax=Actinomyces howellii TaxID=52771 RepID=A0A448HJM0_9ACTO|nr:Uncharacterised protein [Actinomyces howellii]